MGVQVEMGSNATSSHNHTYPADHLVPNRVLGKPAAFDHAVTFQLNPTILLEVPLVLTDHYVAAEPSPDTS